MTELWEIPLTVDSRALLRWAVAELDLPRDVAELVNGIGDDTKSVMADETQLAPLFEAAMAAESSGTYHAISAGRFKAVMKAAMTSKPVRVQDEPKAETVKQGMLF